MKTVALLGADSCALSTVAPRGLISTVRADGNDPKALIEQINAAVKEMRETHEKQINAKVDDVLFTEKIDKLNSHISDIEAALNKANEQIAAGRLGSAPGDMDPTDPEYLKAFKAHFRKGDVNAALSVGTAEEGGYLAPVEWDRTITDQLKQISPIRQNSQVITISGGGFKRVYNDRAIGSGWVGETAARPETATPGITELAFIPGEIYATPAATQSFLDDAAVNVEQWLADEVEYEFARQENIAFLSGNGVNKPFGILTYVAGGANAAKHPFGAIPAIATAAVDALDSDELLDVIYGLPSERSGEAKWYMNRTTLGKSRKLKDGDGNYLWQPSFQASEPSTLAGYPVAETPGMPDVAAGAIPALFGNMRQTYLVVDRIGIRVMRDPYTNKPFVHFYTTKRVGGGVQNPEYMRALKMKAA